MSDIDDIINRHRQGPRERYMRKITDRLRKDGHGDIADVFDDIMDHSLPDLRDLDAGTPLSPEEKKDMEDLFENLTDLLDEDLI